MAARSNSSDAERPLKRPRAASPEAREKQLIALAVDETERLIRSGQATSQLLVHYLKMGSPREQLERERLAGEVELTKKKAEGMESAQRMEELYSNAIDAMRSYSGDGGGEER